MDITKTELVWPDKYNEDGSRKINEKIILPFQIIETINENRIERDVKKSGQTTLFEVYQGKEGDTFEEGWTNKLIWGDNYLVLNSLLDKFEGKVDLIYIDPPFDIGADFSTKIIVGDEDDPLNGKEPSLIEEIAYHDTWGDGYDSYLRMMDVRLRLLHRLLNKNGSIFVHLDVHTGPYIKVLMDEIFGKENFRNQIIWYYYNKMHDSRKKLLPKAFDQILYYVKDSKANFTYNPLVEDRDEPVKQLKRAKIDGKMVNARDEFGKVVYQEKTTRTVDNVWRIRCLQPANKQEWVHYDTQKPVDLLERIISLASSPGDLVLDAFVGSGTTAVAAEKLGRRWICCDLGRFAIHTSRKRLIDMGNTKPFEILNLGKYERQYWQVVKFSNGGNVDGNEKALFDYLAFILKLYGAEPAPGMTHIHGRKGKALVHIGSVDAPVTITEVDDSINECIQLKQRELHILGWEWEMGLNDLVIKDAERRGIKLALFQIPREVIDYQPGRKNVHFYELAYLEVAKQNPKKLSVKIELKDFVIPNLETIPEEVRNKISQWSDFIDYWAIDWNFQNDTFMQGWVAYRTRNNRSLPLSSDVHKYDRPGKYRIIVKVIDIFGNDTSQAVDLEVS